MPQAPFPIQETQVGAIAYLFGITNSGQEILMIGIASFELDSDDISLTWKEKENTDTTGNVQNIIQTNFKYERSIKFSPSGATRAAAAAVAEGVVTLQNLTVANYFVSTFNGTWRIRPGTKINLKMDDDATIDLNCEMYINAQQNAALTGAPIAG
jgi:hypothetical protein